MTGRYAAMFDRLRARGEGAFGAFVMLGDPDLAASAAILDALANAGADMLEVGIPFSDPVADGPTLQAAATRAPRGRHTPPPPPAARRAAPRRRARRRRPRRRPAPPAAARAPPASRGRWAPSPAPTPTCGKVEPASGRAA